MNGLCVWTLKNGHGKTQREAMGRSRDAEEKSDPVTVTVGERLMDPPTHRWTGFSHQMRPGLSALAFHRNLLTSSGLVDFEASNSAIVLGLSFQGIVPNLSCSLESSGRGTLKVPDAWVTPPGLLLYPGLGFRLLKLPR